jgi:predicted  nucleic acid-binding Zn-ribbon protein
MTAAKTLTTAVGEAIVHISKQRTRIEELEHLYSNAIYDLEQAEKLLKNANNTIKDLRDRLRHGPELIGWDG